MRSASDGDRHWQSGLETVAALLAKYTLSVIGSVLTIAGFVTLVTAKSARDFVKEHPYPIYIGLVLAVLIIMATLNYAHYLRQTNARLTSAAAQPKSLQPSAHDLSFYAEMLGDVPVDGHVIAWLRRVKMTELSVTDIPADVLNALEMTAERPRMRPVGFDDQEIAGAFHTFTLAISEFCVAVEQWTLVRHNARWLGVRGELSDATPEDNNAASGTLMASHAKLIQAYDAFIVTAHSHGIDTDAARSPVGKPRPEDS